MRVAVFCNDYWPTIGGVQTGVRGLAAALRGRGHEVLILTCRPVGCSHTELVDGITVRRFAWSFRPLHSAPLRMLMARRQVRETVRSFQPDIVYVHFVSTDALFGRDAARQAGVPFVLSFRGNDAIRIAERGPLQRWLYGRLTAQSSANLFCSAWFRRRTSAARWYRGTPARTGVLADAVDVSRRSHGTEQRPYVLAPGRLVPKKGFDLLLQAWERVSDEIPARLLIAGDGPERASLERLANRVPEARRAQLLGDVPHERLLGMMERAELCIVPSREEPYGIVAVEAQALGVPLLAAAVDNLPSLVEDGMTGYLAAPTADGLAEGMRRAWNDASRRLVAERARGTAGARRTYSAMAEELERWIVAALT